jgi:natural product biosynthesis luciferase-like monooxygenase protein
LHNAIRIAEEWTVVDNLSNGRVGISFASGWQANDFVLAPGNYKDRKKLMLDQIEIVRKLWRGETISQRTPTGDELPVRILPRPVQAELPIWITASGNPETFRLAGERSNSPAWPERGGTEGERGAV